MGGETANCQGNRQWTRINADNGKPRKLWEKLLQLAFPLSCRSSNMGRSLNHPGAPDFPLAEARKAKGVQVQGRGAFRDQGGHQRAPVE